MDNRIEPTTASEGVDVLVQSELAVLRIEASLDAEKAWKKQLEEVILPRLFDEEDTIEKETSLGSKARRGMHVTGSLPKPTEKMTPGEVAAALKRRQDAIAWASENGYDPLIKSKVVAEWDKGERDKALKFYESLRGDNSVSSSLVEDIHHSSLKALVRDRLRRGLETPLETLGVTALTAVRLTKKPKEQ